MSPPEHEAADSPRKQTFIRGAPRQTARSRTRRRKSTAATRLPDEAAAWGDPEGQLNLPPRLPRRRTADQMQTAYSATIIGKHAICPERSSPSEPDPDAKTNEFGLSPPFWVAAPATPAGHHSGNRPHTRSEKNRGSGETPPPRLPRRRFPTKSRPRLPTRESRAHSLPRRQQGDSIRFRLGDERNRRQPPF